VKVVVLNGIQVLMDGKIKIHDFHIHEWLSRGDVLLPHSVLNIPIDVKFTPLPKYWLWSLSRVLQIPRCCKPLLYVKDC
jgi:hypothetical protein